LKIYGNQAWWLICAIPANLEAKIGGSQLEAKPDQKKY
jgi:hypothetical protein